MYNTNSSGRRHFEKVTLIVPPTSRTSCPSWTSCANAPKYLMSEIQHLIQRLFVIKPVSLHKFERRETWCLGSRNASISQWSLCEFFFVILQPPSPICSSVAHVQRFHTGHVSSFATAPHLYSGDARYSCTSSQALNFWTLFLGLLYKPSTSSQIFSLFTCFEPLH